MKLLTWMSILPLLLLLGTNPATAETDQDNDRILVDYLREHFDLASPEYEIEVLSNRLDEVNLSKVEYSVEPLTRRDPLGLFTVAVNTIDSDGRKRSGQVRFNIHRFQEVLILKDKVKRSTELASEQVEVTRVEVTTIKEQPLISADQLNGKRVARNLRKGAILTTNCLENIPDIESGNEISIVYASENCRIAASGVALQNGMTGEFIRVKNSASGKIIMAKIIDSKEVSVEI